LCDLPVDVAQVLAGDLDTLLHGLLTLTNPNTRVVAVKCIAQKKGQPSPNIVFFLSSDLSFAEPNSLLLVGLVGSVGVADLRLEVTLLGLEEVAHADEVGVLGIGVDVHLDDTVGNGRLDLFLGGTGSTVEDEEAGKAKGGQRRDNDGLW
jgi:hypothetical protein